MTQRYRFDLENPETKIFLFNDFQGWAKPHNDIIPIDYNYNKFKYRSPEFNENAEIMFLGCSNTMGDGMLEEFMWANILAKKMNSSYSNLSLSGDSIPGQVMKAFNYFRHFGNPKIIVGLFPLYRLPIPSYMGNNRTRSQQGLKHTSIIQSCNLTISESKKYLKAPFDPEEALSPEVAIFYGHSFIQMLDQYCRSNNIIFIWSVWEEYNNIYNHYKYFNEDFYKNYLDLSTNRWKFNQSTLSDISPTNSFECHLEYKEHILFDAAADRIDDYPHWGIHRNIHVAEEFYEEIKLKKYHLEND